MKIGLVFEFTGMKRPCWSTEVTEKESRCWVKRMQSSTGDIWRPFYEPDPCWSSQTNFTAVVEVHVPTHAVHPATVSRTPASGVGLIYQFTVHDILENCSLTLWMFLSVKKKPPEKYGCSGISTLFSQPCSQSGAHSVGRTWFVSLSPSCQVACFTA